MASPLGETIGTDRARRADPQTAHHCECESDRMDT